MQKERVLNEPCADARTKGNDVKSSFCISRKAEIEEYALTA